MALKTPFGFTTVCSIWVVCMVAVGAIAEDIGRAGALTPEPPKPQKHFNISPGKVTRVETSKANNSYGFFLLYVPKDYTPASPSPMIFCYPPGDTLATLWPFRQVTRGVGFIIVGIPMRTRSLDATGQPAFFEEVLSTVAARLNIDKEMIFMGGFSRGASMTSFLGEPILNRLAGLVMWGSGRSGGVQVNPGHFRGKPIFIGVGDKDDALPHAKRAAEFYRTHGADVTLEIWPDTGHLPANAVMRYTTTLPDWLLANGPLKIAQERASLVNIRDQARSAEAANQLGRAFTLYQRIASRAGDNQFGVEAARAAEQIAQQAEKQLAGAEKAVMNQRYTEAARLLDEAASVYEGSVFAERALTQKQTGIASKADALLNRARTAEKAGEHEKALQLYQLYLTYFPGTDQDAEVKARVKALLDGDGS